MNSSSPLYNSLTIMSDALSQYRTLRSLTGALTGMERSTYEELACKYSSGLVEPSTTRVKMFQNLLCLCLNGYAWNTGSKVIPSRTAIDY